MDCKQGQKAGFVNTRVALSLSADEMSILRILGSHCGVTIYVVLPCSYALSSAGSPRIFEVS